MPSKWVQVKLHVNTILAQHEKHIITTSEVQNKAQKIKMKREAEIPSCKRHWCPIKVYKPSKCWNEL